MKTLDIDALTADRLIRVHGEEHRVKMISAIGAMLAQGMVGETDPIARIEKLCRLVGMVVPTLSNEQVEQLTLDQLNAIAELSTSSLRELQDSLPNDLGPASESNSPA